ncbi:hypothetical protein, partial [Vogesella oryzae]|uniref:hypothetical protein n=1 Tax=Vogesella oryzae TaxID=1735285 RepID=UPI001C2E3FEE
RGFRLVGSEMGIRESLPLSVIRFVKERADFVSLRRQQRRRTIPTRPKPVNTPKHKNRHEFDKSLIRKEAEKQKRLAAANPCHITMKKPGICRADVITYSDSSDRHHLPALPS